MLRRSTLIKLELIWMMMPFHARLQPRLGNPDLVLLQCLPCIHLHLKCENVLHHNWSAIELLLVAAVTLEHVVENVPSLQIHLSACNKQGR